MNLTHRLAHRPAFRSNPFAALRGSGAPDNGKQDHGDDDRGTEQEDDGAVREGPTHGN